MNPGTQSPERHNAGSLGKLSLNILRARTVRGIEPTEYQVPYRNVAGLLKTQVRRHNDKAWLIFYPDPGKPPPAGPVHGASAEVRDTYSYKQFHELVCKTANFLLSQHITRGDRIAVIAYNHADTVIQYFASWMIGAVVVPINIGEDDKRIGYILHNSQAKLAFVRDEFIERTEAILGQSPGVETLVRVGNPLPSAFPPDPGEEVPGRATDEGRYPDFHTSLSNQQSEIRNLPEVSPEDEALIVYTSGTTGLPKGVVLTQYNLLVDAKAIAEWHGMTPDQRMMCVLPIHHVNGTVVTLMAPMYCGGSVVLNQKFHSHKFFERLDREKVNVVSVVPTLLQFLLHENLDITEYDISHVRHVICGAGPLTCELAGQFEERFSIPVIHGYGLSETTCYSCFLPLDLPPEEHRHWLRDFGFPSIGVPMPVNEMTIHDESGQEQPAGKKGEIVIRGHNVMKEYFANPEANEKTFAHGWFRSGDEGFYETDTTGRKFFFISGRIKELIIRGGANISPFEIDELLMNIPGVKAGLAVGFENDWYGEEVGAYVQCKEGSTVTEEDIIRRLRNHLSFQKCPKVVIFGNDIPVTSTGKYQRNKLKPLFEKWKAVQFTESHRQTSA